MNALGLMLLGSIAHATVFALVGAVLYLAVRRSSPATGSFAAGACLLIMAIVSVVVLGPWPRWWTIAGPPSGEARKVGRVVRRRLRCRSAAGPADCDRRPAGPRAAASGRRPSRGGRCVTLGHVGISG